MEFKINHVKIENFRCFDSVDTDLWLNTLVEGSNESGKSTFASSILWCLTGKDVEGNSTFEIVPIGKYGEVSPSVELECIVGERPVTLKRTYKAKFTRDKKFSDYAVTTHINGIETGVRKFQDWVSNNICNEQVFKILSNPKTFVEDCPKETKELVWQAQRRLLMSIIGDQKNDYEVAMSDAKWELIAESLKRYDNANQYMMYLKKEYSQRQKELDSFDVRIAQQEKNIVNLEHTESNIEELVQSVKKQASDLNAQNEAYKKSQRNGKVQELKAEIDSLSKEKDAMEKKYNEDREVYIRTKAAYKAQAESLKQTLDESMKTLKTYAEAVDKLKSTVVVEVCETCGQKLTRHAIENSKKRLEARIKNGEQKTAQLSNSVAETKKRFEFTLSKSRSIMEPTYPSKIDSYKEQINELTEKLLSVQVEKDMPGYADNMKTLEKQMDTLREEYSILKQNAQSENEINNIEDERKKCVLELSELQRNLDLVKQFISFKCESFESAINALFDNVKFQLFEQNKSNEDVRETCILRYRGVKYEDLSYSTKIFAGLEVVKAFQKFYNITAPIFIDNAESITGNAETGAQTFFMKVREELCPECNGQSGRRNTDGTWTCQKCGHVWKKKLKIVEE